MLHSFHSRKRRASERCRKKFVRLAATLSVQDFSFCLFLGCHEKRLILLADEYRGEHSSCSLLIRSYDHFHPLLDHFSQLYKKSSHLRIDEGRKIYFSSKILAWLRRLIGSKESSIRLIRRFHRYCALEIYLHELGGNLDMQG